MEVSIDVSTGDHDAGHRLFGTVTLVQENQGGKHGLILLVQDPEPNFKAQPEQEPWCMKMNGCKTKCEDCPDEAAQPEQEPLEYWNAVEGWVKIDEVRQHFETVNCGTIYKTAGEGRVPLYTTPPKRKPLTDQRINEVYQEATCQSLRPQDYKLVREFARAIEAAHGIKEKNND